MNHRYCSGVVSSPIILILLYSMATSLFPTNINAFPLFLCQRRISFSRGAIEADINTVDIISSVDSVPMREDRVILPTVNTKSYLISLSNPFGPAVKSIDIAKDELLKILDNELSMSISDTNGSNFFHGRIEYLLKILESRFIPIQTIPFLNLAIGGDWNMRYSNVLTPHKDENL